MMNLGDSVMITAQVKKAYRTYGLPVLPIDRLGKHLSSNILLENNPKIFRGEVIDKTAITYVHTGSGRYPYIDFINSHGDTFLFKEWGIEPGEIFFDCPFPTSWSERLSKCVLIEPNTSWNVNKQWGFSKWQELVRRNKHIEWIQLVNPHATVSRMLDGVTHMSVNTKELIYLMKYIWTFVVPEGGLHHTAAAWNKPGVVIFGGYIHPRYTGYSFQSNLYHGETCCGNRKECRHCRDAMSHISVEQVEEALHEVLKG